MIINNKENTFKSFLKTQGYFLKLIYQEHPKSITIFFVLTLLSSITPALLIYLNKAIIDAISLLPNEPDKYQPAILLLFIMFAVQYISALFSNILEYIFSKIQHTIRIVLRRLINYKLVRMPLEEYEDNEFFDNVNLANIAINGNGTHVVSNTINMIGNIVSLVSIVGILLSIHWTMPVALFLSTLPGILLIFVSKSKKFRMSRVTSPVERELAFTNELFMNKSSMKEIKLYNIGGYLIDKWTGISKIIKDRQLKIALWESKTKSIGVFVLQISSLGVSLLLISQVYRNTLSIGSYVALLGAVTSVQGLFGSIGGSLGSIFEVAIYNNALMKILNYQNKCQFDLDQKLDRVNHIEKISLENVSFVYPKTTTPVLNNISLDIRKGEKISIVGSNGSGKTTLVNCLLGLYEICNGAITVNGTNLNQLNQEEFYSKVSVVLQDFTKYKFSIRENIGIGDLSKLYADEHLYNILKKVGLYEKIPNFTNGLETNLTKEYTGGTELSGGEWQRIALARAFFKDSELIVLDEPTAALDPITELNIFNLFHQLSRNKTTITISHRIGPTKNSDRIIVMDKGSIVEQGSFDFLIEKRGLYYKMYNSQMMLYQNKTVIKEEEGS